LAIGLKTGMYYLRTKAAVDAIKFTLNNDKKAEPTPTFQNQ
jgi:ribonucleoside-diphosphate reductase alpha chain